MAVARGLIGLLESSHRIPKSNSKDEAFKQKNIIAE